MDRRIQWALARIDADLRRVDLDALAAEVHLSPSRFRHLFREHAGTSPARHVHVLRMERARVLLERTFLSVKEVMLQVGVSDASHFSRDFRRHHGVAPSEVRRVAAPAGLANEQ